MSIELSDSVPPVSQVTPQVIQVIIQNQVPPQPQPPQPQPPPPPQPPSPVVSEYLTESQREIIQQLYGEAKQVTHAIFSVSTMDHVTQVGKMLAELVKLLERATYRGHRIPGTDKKVIVLELGRLTLQDVLQDPTVRQVVLAVYDAVGETTLELLVDVSRHLNVAVKEVAISCCESFVKCLK